MNTTLPAHALRQIGVTFLLCTAMPLIASAFPISVTIEPDSYGNSQILNQISPYVTLSTGVPPANAPTFDVVAYTDTTGASTGNKVFAHAGGIPFWNTSRTLRMDFDYPVTSVHLDYIASGFMNHFHFGRLEAYSSLGTLLDSYTTSLLGRGQHETMSVVAPQIAYAIAYPPSDPFGDLDRLTFSSVPEPATAIGMLLSVVPVLASLRRHSTRRGI